VSWFLSLQAEGEAIPVFEKPISDERKATSDKENDARFMRQRDYFWFYPAS
jgi:hypothetical protein